MRNMGHGFVCGWCGWRALANLNGTSLTLQLHILLSVLPAGQERFRAVTRSYYRGAVGALIVFDVTDRDSFAHLTSWLTDARTLAWSDVSIFIVGNKIDDEENREVTMLEAASFAQENSCVAFEWRIAMQCSIDSSCVYSSSNLRADVGYIETSAMTGVCVDESFTKLARAVIETIDSGDLDLTQLGAGGAGAPGDGGLVVNGGGGGAPTTYSAADGVGPAAGGCAC